MGEAAAAVGTGSGLAACRLTVAPSGSPGCYAHQGMKETKGAPPPPSSQAVRASGGWLERRRGHGEVEEGVAARRLRPPMSLTRE